MKVSTGRVISGLPACLIRVFLIINIYLILLKYSRSFAGSIRLLKKIRSKRQSLQGLPPILKFIRAGHKFYFSENVPGFPSPAFNDFVIAEIRRTNGSEKRYPLVTVILAITSRCRLRCRHCYEWDNLSATDNLTSDDLRKIVSKLREYGVSHIQFSGGEPIERFEDLIDLIGFAGKGTDLWILTSGFGLTPEKARILKEAGLTGVDISLDSSDEDAHNNSRNNPESFKQALQASVNCRNAGLITAFSLCTFRESVSIDNLLRYAELAKSYGAGFIRLLEPRKAGRYSGKDILLENEHIKVLEDFYIMMNTSKDYAAYPVVSYSGFGQRRTGCSGAGNRYLYIDSAGHIHACPFCQESAGNALTDDIAVAIGVLRKKGCHEFALNTSG